MSSTQRIGQLLTIAASIAGAAVSVVLLAIHVSTSSGDLIAAQQLCGDGPQFDCSAAAASDWSELFGIPIAGFGLGFYMAMGLVALLAFVPSFDHRDDKKAPPEAAALAFGGFVLSILYSAFLAYINFTQLEKSCDKCMMLYAANAVGLFASALWMGGSLKTLVAHSFGRIGKLLGHPLTGIAALTFAVGTAGAAWQTHKRIAADEERIAASVEEAGVAGTQVDTTLLYNDNAASWGPEDAPIQLVEFSDFECPYCSRFAAVVNQLKNDYEGNLRVVFRNFPLSFHVNARLLARGAVCANAQGNFWAFHDVAFQRQARLNRPGASPLSVQDVAELAGDVGLNAEEMRFCLESSASDEQVARDRSDGEALGLRGTPTIFVNGRQWDGPLEPAAFRAYFDTLLEDEATE